MSIDALSKYRHDVLTRYDPGFQCFREAEHALVSSTLATVPNSGTILDAGCGYTSSLRRCDYAPRQLIGVDLDHEALRQNTTVRLRCVCDLASLPFREESLSFVVSRDVLEHLEKPNDVLDEFARVLRPGGALVISGTNTFNYISALARLTPVRLKTRLRRLTCAGPVTEDLPVYYRANRLSKLKRMLEERGLKHVESGYYGRAFDAFLFCRPLFVLAVVGDCITNLRRLRWLKGTFLGVWLKETPVCS